jgi:hypothetical protein
MRRDLRKPSVGGSTDPEDAQIGTTDIFVSMSPFCRPAAATALPEAVGETGPQLMCGDLGRTRP